MYLGTIIDPPGIAGSMATLLSPISTLYQPARARSRYFPISHIMIFLLIQVDHVPRARAGRRHQQLRSSGSMSGLKRVRPWDWDQSAKPIATRWRPSATMDLRVLLHAPTST